MTSVSADRPQPTDASLRRIAGLALPALVVLAAEPLYVLVDTAVVGHLGRTALAALAVGASAMSLAAWLGVVLAYGTTGRTARQYGAGDSATAVAEGVQASWLALGAGMLLAVTVQFAAGPVARVLAGAHPDVAHAAEQWLRIAVLGAPGLMLAAAGNGWMRGVQDTRRPAYYVLGANVLSAAACPVLVYPLGLGLTGSATANAIAQTITGGLFVRALVAERVPLAPRPALLKRQIAIGRDLLLRGLAFQASFLSATAVAARFGVAAVAAHQIAFQLWSFCALAMDAVAIAAQAMIGAALGGGQAAAARALAGRIAAIGAACGAGFAILIGAGAGVLPVLFSPDPQVHAQAMVAWPWFVLMQPLAGVVFALDGVLIGAGDVRFLRDLTLAGAFLVFLPAIWVAYALDLGLGGVWAGLALFVAARLAGVLARLRSGQWAVVGATP